MKMHNIVHVTFSTSAEDVRRFTETYQLCGTEFTSGDN